MDALDLLNNPNVRQGFGNLSSPLQVALLLGALTFIPAMLVTLTSYTRIIIVLSFVRQALATPQLPPNIVLNGMALFLTLFIMQPTIDDVGRKAITPYLNQQLNEEQALREASSALKEFMLRQTRKSDLALFLKISGNGEIETPEQTPFFTLVPAFVLSELKTAFIMGFCIYLPFLMVDLVVSSVLTSMGMVMMPPALISAPFKILLFVLADGWHLIMKALSVSFA
jgi:flagellar biosynthetic protein FliP